MYSLRAIVSLSLLVGSLTKTLHVVKTMCDEQQQPAQPPTASTLHVYKAPTGRYLLTTMESQEAMIASFNNVGGHLPAIITKLSLQDDQTVSEPLDAILAAIHSQLSVCLKEERTGLLVPCHKDFAMKATDMKRR